MAAVRLQLHALAYNLGNFLRTLATPEPIKDWSLTSLKEKLIKIGAKIISHGRYVASRWPMSPFRELSSPTSSPNAAATGHIDSVRRSFCHAFHQTKGKVRLDDGNCRISSSRWGRPRAQTPVEGWWRRRGLVGSA
jgi:Transposase DDE domain group 1